MTERRKWWLYFPIGSEAEIRSNVDEPECRRGEYKVLVSELLSGDAVMTGEEAMQYLSDQSQYVAACEKAEAIFVAADHLDQWARAVCSEAETGDTSEATLNGLRKAIEQCRHFLGGDDE